MTCDVCIFRSRSTTVTTSATTRNLTTCPPFIRHHIRYQLPDILVSTATSDFIHIRWHIGGGVTTAVVIIPMIGGTQKRLNVCARIMAVATRRGRSTNCRRRRLRHQRSLRESQLLHPVGSRRHRKAPSTRWRRRVAPTRKQRRGITPTPRGMSGTENISVQRHNAEGILHRRRLDGGRRRRRRRPPRRAWRTLALHTESRHQRLSRHRQRRQSTLLGEEPVAGLSVERS